MALENNVNGRNGNSYELLAENLREMISGMTPKEIESKWPGNSVYLQNVDTLVVYLRKQKREIEERKEKVPQEFYDQTQSLDYPKLKTWRKNNEGLKHRQTQLKEIVYRERLLELIAQKFGFTIEAALKRKNNDGRIRTSQDLKNVCDSDPKARYLMKLCQGDDVDVADIIAVVYDGKIARDDAIKLLQTPALQEYLGEFRKPTGIPDIEEYASQLLPFDKNRVIASIVYKRLIEYRRSKLGAKPSAEQRIVFLEEMNKTLEDLV